MASAIASAAHNSFITPLLFQRQCFDMWGAGEERMAKERKVLVLVLELGRRKGNRELRKDRVERKGRFPNNDSDMWGYC